MRKLCDRIVIYQGHNPCSFRVKYQPGIDFVDFLLVVDPRRRPATAAALDHTFFWDAEMKPCRPSECVPHAYA